jgi:phosphoglycolate phosphatase-like HAD superfamily hydrolase
MSRLLENKRVVVFDFDGTLVDTMSNYSRIFEKILDSFPNINKEMALSQYIETCGLPFWKQLELMFPELEESKREDITYRFEKEKVQVVESSALDSGVEEALGLLKERGHFLVVSSSTKQELIENMLRRYRDLFHLVLGYKEPDFGKGAAHFGVILDTFNVSNKDVMFVGDSLRDYLIACDSDIDFIPKLGTFTKDRFDEMNVELNFIVEIADLV